MAVIVVLTEAGERIYAERVQAELYGDAFYCGQLQERIGWALVDAEAKEVRPDEQEEQVVARELVAA